MDLSVARRQAVRLARWPITLLLASALIVPAGSATAANLPAGLTHASAPAAARVSDLCAAAAPGQARCFSQRLVNPAASRPSLLGAGAAATPATTPGGYGPSDLSSAYQLDTSKGYGQTVAVVDAYDDPNAAADLAVYRSQYGLPPCTVANGCFSKVNQSGTTSPLPAPSTGWSGEISLDLDMVSAVCPLCNILLVEASSSYLSDLGTAVDAAVRLGAKFVSNSYGGGEYSGVSGNDVHYNHPGVAITVSTGDSGYGVSYPATSPYVTAVGGTSLVRAAGGRGWTETAWAGAGSGCSGFSSQPSIQVGISTGCAKRAVADVSAVANPSTGVAVYVTYGGGGWGVYGGTSASAPIIASVYALAGTPGTTDYPNSYPYRNTSSLYDVTSGTNGSCSVHAQCAAGTGWDGPTGLGTPNTAAAFSATGTVSGTPARFGATGQVGATVIAGLPVTIAATPLLPDGDSLASISWKSARTDCLIAASTALSSTVTCPASMVGSTTVTATLTDAQAVTKTVTLGLSFAVPAIKRAVTIAVNVAGQTGASQSLCTSAATPIRAVVTDTETGLPVRGLTVTFTRQPSGGAISTVGSAISGPDGVASSSINSALALTLAAKSAAVGAFVANAGTSLSVSTLKCSPALSGAMDRTSSYYGDPVVVTATVTRTAGNQQVVLPGASVQVVQVVAGRAIVLASAMTAADGSVRVVLKPTASGSIGLNLPATVGWTSASAALGTLTVLTPSTAITASSGSANVGYGAPVVVTGTLTRTAGAVTGPLAGASVSVKLLPSSGAALVLGSGVVSAAGSWTVTIRPTKSGTLSAVYAGAAGRPAATADLGALQVGSWTATVSLTTQLSAQLAGAANKLTGTVTRSYGVTSEPAPSVPVGIYLQTTGGSQLLLTTVTTGSAGTFTATVAPTENGTLTARLHSVAGYSDASSTQSALSVSSKLVVTAPSVVAVGVAVPLTVQLTAARAGLITIEEYTGGSWASVATGTAPSTGRLVVPVTGLAAGSHLLRASFGGDARGGAGSSASVTVLVR